MKESDIHRKILKYLNSLPSSCFDISPPNSNTAKPDITGVINGRYVAIEVKKPGKNLRRAQAYKLDKLRKAGAITLVAHSVDDVKEYLPRFLP